MIKISTILEKIFVINNKYESIADITGENFNIFKILNIETNEIKLHSTFIAELLNPNSSHGQKDIFLKLFVNQIKKKIKFDDFDTKNAKVEKEKYIGKKTEIEGGRIDIVITSPKQNIFIENKIYAGDQPQQLLRYHNKDKNAILLYLTLFGKDASTISTTSSNKYKSNNDQKYYHTISYEKEITAWLEACKKEAVNLPMLRETISQYINIVKYLTGQTINEKMKNEIVEQILKSPENLESAILIEKEIINAKIELQRRFWIKLKNKIINLKLDYITDIKEVDLDDKGLKRFYFASGENYFYQGISFNIHKINENNFIRFYIQNIYEEIAISIVNVDFKGTHIKTHNPNFNIYFDKFRELFKNQKFNTIRNNTSGWIYTKFKHNFKKFSSKEVYKMTDEAYLNNRVDVLFDEIRSYIESYHKQLIDIKL